MKHFLYCAVALVMLMGATPCIAQAVTLKIATLSPEGSMWMEKMRQGAEQVADQTLNRVTFRFYPGGVMGNDKAVLRKIRVGQLHGGAVVGGGAVGFFPGKPDLCPAHEIRHPGTDGPCPAANGPIYPGRPE